MKAYRTKTPRTSIGVAAVAMTALTLGLAIVLPASEDAADAISAVLATQSVPAAAPTAIPTIDRIEVVAIRERSVAARAAERRS